MRSFSFASRLIRPVLLACAFALTAFGQNTGSLSGTVQDPQGNAVAGAKVTVSDPARNFQLDATTSSEGTFSFAALQPSTYTVAVEAQGFKKLVKTGVVLNVADRQSIGTLTLEVGSLTGETVEVTADAAQLQIKTESGEQSTAINNQQLQNLAINGRNYLDLVRLTPGVVNTANLQVAGPGGLGSISIAGARQNQHNLTIDGTTNVDTGSNGTQHIALSLDNIAEFKVLTSNYQAEYGRSAGGDIKILTKSGTSEFHGTGYWFHRHEQFNANSFFNNAQGRIGDPRTGIERNPRNFYRYNYQGYNIGGPVYLPKNVFGPLGVEKTKEKLFFFWAQEWQEQLVPQAARRSRVPTALEVAGDFSQTRDGNGNPIFIRDPSKTGTCSASDQTACFTGNRIPTALINPSGQALLRTFNRFANVSLADSPNGAQFNHNTQQSVSYPRRENSIRIDYNATENTRMYIRYTRDSDQQIMPYGLGWTGGSNQIPFDNLVFKQAPAWNGTFNVTSTLSPTLTNEFVFGSSQNNLTLDPSTGDGSYSGLGLSFKLPYAYPANQWWNISFGGIPNQNFAGLAGYSQFPYKNSNTTFDIYDNVSKVWGAHTLKAGIFYQRSRKDQAAGDSAFIGFGNDPANPNNVGHPYANALLGNFDTYRQPNIGVFQGQYRSTNLEWYLQDNWKVNSRLTLDYGLRMNLIYPQYDSREQDFYFVPSRYDRSKAVRLYRRATNGQAFDPANPNVLLPAYLIGRIVPGSGDPFNGQVGSKDGYFPGGIKNRGIQWGPAFGFAFDVFGNQKTVVRGGYRIGYDRVSGNALIFPAVGQPPLFVNPTFNYGNLATIGQGSTTFDPRTVALGTSGPIGADPEGHVANVQSFSLQVQQQIGFDTVVSVGYVGSLGRHLQEVVNLNYIPYGALFKKENQDPSRFAGGIVPDEEPGLAQVYKDAGVKFSGTNALPADFLRAFPGYNTIGMRTFGGSSNYHSLQFTLNRKFTRSFTYGVSYTWSKVMGTANGDGDFINPICSRCADYRRLAFDRTHNLVVSYDWKLPQFGSNLGNNWLTKGVLNGWQVTGISTFMSGQPEDVGISIPNINLNQRVGGSWTEPVRAIFSADPQGNMTREKFFNWESIRLPTVKEALAAQGAFPRNFVVRPGIRVTDLSVFKNFPLGGDSNRNLQLRVEMFNVFNTPQFSDINRSHSFNICGNFNQQVVTNANSPAVGQLICGDYNAFRQASPDTLTNLRNSTVRPNNNVTTVNGVPRAGTSVSPVTGPSGAQPGEVNGLHGSVSDRRVIQLAVKIFF
jgi:hypothetical protein